MPAALDVLEEVEEVPAKIEPDASKKPRRQGGGEEEFHVLRVPLKATRRDRMIVAERLLVAGLLKRAFLRLLLKRANALFRDPDWTKAKLMPKRTEEERALRSAAFRAVRKRHGLALTTLEASELCKKLLRGADRKRERDFESRQAKERALAESEGRKPRRLHGPKGWMGDVVASRVAGALGKEVWKAVDEWLYGKRGKPRPKPPHLTRCVWNEDNRSGLYLDGDCLIWRQAGGSRRKDLRIPLAKREGSAWWAKRLLERRVLAVGVLDDAGVLYALIRVAGEPYRDPEYLAAVAHGEAVGMDPAPSSPGFVSSQRGWVGTLASEEAIDRQRELDRKVRRLQRAQERSRRATNPEMYDEQGRKKKGVKQKVRSRPYKARQRELKRLQRRGRAQRRTEAEQTTRGVMLEGTLVGAEQGNHQSWPARYGKRMLFTRPGEMYARLRKEAKLLRGVFLELPLKLALSQHCLCGAGAKKELSERVHHCSRCGLGPLQRDVFSAFLARLILLSGEDPNTIDLSQGPFDTEENRRLASELCSVSKVASAGQKGSLTSVRPLSGPAAQRAKVKHARTLGVGREPAKHRQTSPPLALLGEVAAGLGGVPGSEGTRPLDDRAPQGARARATASGGDGHLTRPPPQEVLEVTGDLGTLNPGGAK